ncbi:Hydantoinase/oxoprolinase-domain-containing protein [Aspergillus granulosus]|uniref:Hydantoinase/oxoprolinase-domain-containing protein n=1 Tax=Aspergillus granulosus TaxID=176169 RepID=A0ABR4HUX3_9EURO
MINRVICVAPPKLIRSSDILREVGEYERTVTTCTNALVKPVMQTYLSNLQTLLAEDGDVIRILKSDSGFTSLDLAGQLLVNILISGPAGGIQGVADVVTQNTPFKNLITFDMGGTSTDVALIYQGKPQLRWETVIAGGGLITKYMDILEILRVGPESAGATPGTAAYNKGGSKATVTNANLVLGYLLDTPLGGEFTLNTQAAWDAVEGIAKQIDLPVTQMAEDVINMVNETMYGALRLVSIEQGYNPKDFALVVFSGAGPLHANAVGKLLGAWPVIMPPSPGTLCALGDATTRLSHLQSSSFISQLSATTSGEVKRRFGELEKSCWETMHSSNATRKSSWMFNQLHDQQFKYCFPNFELELMRLKVVALRKAVLTKPPSAALVLKKKIVVQGQEIKAALWDQEKVSQQGVRLDRPCIITKTDGNTLILPGNYSEINSIGNILIRPVGKMTRDDNKDQTAKATLQTIQSTPLIPTLVALALASIRGEMDILMLRCSMSPAIREQQDEFNVITTAKGKMLGTIEEGNMFITNNIYMIKGAVTHLNDVIVLLPIFHEGRLLGWASQFGHLTNISGIVPGSMSINTMSAFDNGGAINLDIVDLLCSCRTAASRVCELATRFRMEIYLMACTELLRNHTTMAKIIDADFDPQPTTFTDFVDDDGHGMGPYALTCIMTKLDGGRFLFDWSGTSPQSSHSINFYLLETMFKMFIGYYMIAAAAPGTVINDGFHHLINVYIPKGSILKPVRPALISCRTHMLGRTMDVMQALIVKKNPVYAAAAGFSNSPHFFYSGYKPDGEWYQLYQIRFGSFTKPWGIEGGKPGSRSRKVLYWFSKSESDLPVEVLPLKCDHVMVDPGDLLKWVTWGGGGLGNPLTRPAEKVTLLDVWRKLITVQGARENYGIKKLAEARNAAGGVKEGYNHGGSLEELRKSCLEETGLAPPSPQWDVNLYGPHVCIPYVQEWYKKMKEAGGWDL